MGGGGGAVFRWVMQLHKDVPRAARFYSEGLGFTVNVCTPRWAQLQSDSFNLALLHSPRSTLASNSFIHENVGQEGYSSLLSFTVTDINSTVMKLIELGAQLDGPIRYETHGNGKVAAMRCLDGHMVGLHEPA